MKYAFQNRHNLAARSNNAIRYYFAPIGRGNVYRLKVQLLTHSDNIRGRGYGWLLRETVVNHYEQRSGGLDNDHCCSARRALVGE